MAFEWNRIHKWEDNIEREITDSVYEYICENYTVDEVHELSKDQFMEVVEFHAEIDAYSIMSIGFHNFINYWQEENGWID